MTPDTYFNAQLPQGTIWLPEVGMGYHNVGDEDPSPYDRAYFEKYRGYAETEMGRRITKARVELVNRYTTRLVLDVGIGSGHFVETRARRHPTVGYDICCDGVAWLRERGLFVDPYEGFGLPAFTCWDSLEHVEDPARLVARVRHYLFVTLPLVPDGVYRTDWKHVYPREHRWHWSRDGFLGWISAQGFKCVAESRMEEQFGREDVGTFVFERRR